MFVIYSDTTGNNVTLSPRSGKGHIMPLHDSDSQVTLLEGSEISDGKMTANVRCRSCIPQIHPEKTAHVLCRRQLR